MCSIILLRVGGFGFSIGLDRVLPGWLDGSLISGINDSGDKAVFLGGCKESVGSTLGMFTDVSDDEV